MSSPITILGQTTLWPTTGDTGYSNAALQTIQNLATAVAPIEGLYNTTTGLVGNLAYSNSNELTLNGIPVSSGGTVTSVGISGANGIGVASSPITSSGTIALSLGDLTPTGNLTLATTKRFFGDFSNATAANRTIVQTSTTNGATTLSVAPNGTGTVSAFSAENNSTIGNNAALFMASNASANVLMSGTRGSGTQLPLYIGSVTGLSMTAGTSAIVINTANQVSMPQSLSVTGTINGSNLSGTNTGDQTLNSLLPSQAGNSGKILSTDGTNALWVPDAAGTGTVTSVDAAVNNGITVSGGPITTSGTLTFGLGDLTPTGNLTLATTKHFIGDFSNATAANRSYFQTSTVNGPTTIQSIPNGTGTVAAFAAENSSTLGNNSTMLIGTTSTASLITSGTRGSGTQLPIYIGSVTGLTLTSGTSAIVISTSNDVTMPQSLTVTGTASASNLSGTNTGDQTITLTGDVTGSGTGSFATTLANTAVTPGSYTYSNITVDSKGRITSASSGAAPTGGTVTSVDAAVNNGITVSGGPITTSGTLTFGLGNITPANVTPTGTLTLASSLPVTGDLTTLATRAYFQTSTANSTTSLDVSPSGTGTRAIVYAYDNSDRANSAYVAMDANSFSGFAGLYTNVNGTGTQRGLLISAAGNIGFGITTTGNAFAGSSSLTTSSTDGYVYLPSIAGVPAGIPTTVTNRNAVAVDRTNGNLYFYAGSWKKVLTSTAPSYETAVATAAQTVFNTTLATVANGSGKAYLQVFVNGVKQIEGAGKAYTVTGANQITFNAGLALSDDVEFYAFE